MSSFTSPLVVSPLLDGRKWKLVRPFSYHIGSEYSGDIIWVPAGFVTDFASVPRVLWTFLPSWGRYGKGAVLHDYLYQFLYWMLEQPQYESLFDHFSYARKNPRKFADDIFYEAMLVGGTKPWKAWIMYRGVRLLGWLAWRKK